MPKKISCRWCGMGHAPRSDGNHWIVKSIIPAKITIKECAYHKAGTVSPIQHTTPIPTTQGNENASTKV